MLRFILSNFTGEGTRSDFLLATLRNGRITPVQTVRLQQIQARIIFSKQDWAAGLEVLLDGLRDLGISIKMDHTDEEARSRYWECREMITGHGVEDIRNIPIATDQQCHLCNTLLSE